MQIGANQKPLKQMPGICATSTDPSLAPNEVVIQLSLTCRNSFVRVQVTVSQIKLFLDIRFNGDVGKLDTIRVCLCYF